MPGEHGGEILLLAPGWTYFVVVRRIVGNLPHYTPNDDARCPSWGELKNLPTMLSCHSERGGEILLLAPSWTSVVVWRVVASMSISPPCTE